MVVVFQGDLLKFFQITKYLSCQFRDPQRLSHKLPGNVTGTQAMRSFHSKNLQCGSIPALPHRNWGNSFPLLKGTEKLQCALTGNS